MQHCSVSGSGKLVSWTVIRRPPTKFRAKGPYTIAIVDLDAGVRLTGRLTTISERVRPGVDVAFIGMDDAIHLFEERTA
jgi:hypothetical protein